MVSVIVCISEAITHLSYNVEKDAWTPTQLWFSIYVHHSKDFFQSTKNYFCLFHVDVFAKNMLMELAGTLGLGAEESHSTVTMYGSSIFLNVEGIHCQKKIK